MRNIYISAKHNPNSKFNNTAPEYAVNHLDVEISFPQCIKVSELSIRIYDENYKYISSDVIILSENKIKKALFDIASSERWEEKILNVYVFINGRAKWHCELFLLNPSENFTEKEKLLPIKENSFEQFFAEQLSISNWWNLLYTDVFDIPSIHDLIEKLLIFNNKLKEQYKSSIPILFIVLEDENNGLKKLTSKFISGFLSKDNNYHTLQLSLNDFINSSFNCNEINDNIESTKKIILEVPLLNYNIQTVNLINILLSMITNISINKDRALIMYGTKESINMIKEKCYIIKNLINKDNTINLSSKNTIDNYGSDIYEEDEQEALFIHKLFEDKFKEVPNDNAEKELDQMIGLQKVKKDMREAWIMSLFNKKRAEMSLQKNKECINHMFSLGNPGTGKTTVARLVGRIYHKMGFLSKGHTVETNRAKLVGEYIGMTEKKTLEAIDEARGGVLFIDEAYTLIQSKDNDTKDFGKEVINTLLPVLSEPNPDLIVIMAGYQDKMMAMLKTNPGLKDRFPLTFTFEDYTKDELMEIACGLLKSENYQLTTEAYNRLYLLIDKATTNKDEYFGNGRWIHNLINQGIIKSMAKRVMQTKPTKINIETLSRIEETDIIEAESNYLEFKYCRKLSSRTIGFRA